MKTSLFRASFIAASLLPVFSVAAYDGVLTFKGEITNTTCKISVNGNGSTTEIIFPPISVTALPAVGSVANAQPIVMQLSECQNATTNARALFESVSADPVTGNLVNIGTARNVQVQLLDQDRQKILVNDPSQNQGPSFKIKDNAATLKYFAQYFAVDKVVGGNVYSQVNYSISYF